MKGIVDHWFQKTIKTLNHTVDFYCTTNSETVKACNGVAIHAFDPQNDMDKKIKVNVISMNSNHLFCHTCIAFNVFNIVINNLLVTTFSTRKINIFLMSTLSLSKLKSYWCQRCCKLLSRMIYWQSLQSWYASCELHQ